MGVLSPSLLMLSLFHLSVSLLLIHFVTCSLFSFLMGKTRLQNQTVCLAAPVMTEAAKIKASISTKCHDGKQMKDNKICELQACIDALEKLGKTSAVLKEPLVS